MAEMAASRSRSRVAAKRAASAEGLSVFSPAATLSGLGGIKFFWKWFLANPGFLIEKLGRLVNRALLKDRETVQLEWPLTLPRERSEVGGRRSEVRDQRRDGAGARPPCL